MEDFKSAALDDTDSCVLSPNKLIGVAIPRLAPDDDEDDGVDPRDLVGERASNSNKSNSIFRKSLKNKLNLVRFVLNTSILTFLFSSACSEYQIKQDSIMTTIKLLSSYWSLFVFQFILNYFIFIRSLRVKLVEHLSRLANNFTPLKNDVRH